MIVLSLNFNRTKAHLGAMELFTIHKNDMVTIKLIGNLETITFEKSHSVADEWRVRSSSTGGGKTNLSTEEVARQVEYLQSKGFKKS